MRGNEIFKVAVRSMAQSAQQALNKAGLGIHDIRAVIPHQANHRILTAAQETLGIDDKQMFVNIDRYGNTGASSIPIALGEFLQRESIDVGEHLLFIAFGGGLTWGAAVLRWADIPAVKIERQDNLVKAKLALAR
jgi:3-oxoacyl-[acyl-carrier-protein] synthase-3